MLALKNTYLTLYFKPDFNSEKLAKLQSSFYLSHLKCMDIV